MSSEKADSSVYIFLEAILVGTNLFSTVLHTWLAANRVYWSDSSNFREVSIPDISAFLTPIVSLLLFTNSMFLNTST